VGEGEDTAQGDLRESGSYGALWLPILVVTAISALIAFAGHEWGVANDCAADGIKHDGQCGLASAMGDLFGFVGGGLFFVIGMATALIGWPKRRAELPKR
jgi:hypothetical protein